MKYVLETAMGMKINALATNAESNTVVRRYICALEKNHCKCIRQLSSQLGSENDQNCIMSMKL